MLLPLALLLGLAPPNLADRPNVLFVAIDDLNDWVGCLNGHPQAQTPHLDRLAARGMLFTNAHCQAPLCNPSRSSLLTGLRPTTTGIYGLAPGIRVVERTRNHVTLPQAFTQAGYHTVTAGKVYHDGSIPPKERPREFTTWGPAPGMGKPALPFAQLPTPRHPAMDWGPFPAQAEQAADYQIASATCEALKSAPADRPFLIACGFRLPHVPCYAPPEWFDRFPRDSVQLPPILADDRRDTPRFSWYLHWRLPEPRTATLEARQELRPLVRAYLASTAFMDAQLGRVLAALENTGRSRNTLVILWSDHGYHLGEKGITGKNTLWERSTRVPLVIAGPGVSTGKCAAPVELLDLFPTLVDFAQLPPRSDLEGLSLRPQLTDANTPRERPAITTHNPGNHSVRTDRYRYIRYADGSEELYDCRTDPNEWTNRASDPALADVKARLKKWLPTTEAAHAPGSRERILRYNPATGDAEWEGKVIPATEAPPGP
jgi:arylsulfatase A-like enzyme